MKSENRRTLASALATSRERPTAFFAPQTILSEAMVHAVYQSGLKVPEEISVVGYTAQEVPDFTSIRARS